ncbi:MAG: ribonuclease Y [Candidatus Woykebacteria bacterium RIFCSPHIGHO2_12_FULL_45_10]|uniref:Ribonuclease Y n=1 Tax=Candidatus Woykebacteria bacterium RIFCSPHIGHO2_12_FULL_45_10 TaxID=1802603 RepID=A0A1G1WNQ1_9BACT|nr:MAG: ribonuclease Y [Candidatus Woykebacteria bacterium RIFCSPHIGHO2_12_FULL_45_10]
MDPILIAVISLAVGAGGVYVYQNNFKSKQAKTKEEKPDSMAKEIVLEAKDEALRIKKEAEDEARKIRSEVLGLESRLAVKEESIEKKLSEIETKEKQVQDKIDEAEKTRTELGAKLEKVAGVTRDEAKKLILDATEARLKDEIARRIREGEEQVKKSSDEKAKEILVDAMKAGATDYVAEYTTSVVKLEDEDMKGRIIGREGRNIKAFEMATGVDVDLDDSPGTIRLSSFDGERREVAKVALERLMADGRIQPTRIEEIVDRVRKDFEKIRREEGEKLCSAVGVHNLPNEIVETIGRFKWRFSYGQNLWLHTIEETKIGMAIAREIGADVNIVRLGCLFHDIGKVFTGEQEGTHVQLGVDFLKKFNVDPKVLACVAEHHEDKPFSAAESVIVWIADAISGSRPGARHESIEDYIKRVTEIENVASSFQGVDRSFAIAAGREVRVIVIPEQIDDAAMTKLANDVANKIHDSITYPGQVKVTVVRETRAESVAR